MSRAQGIDVSRYQTSTPSLAGRSFLIARATFGLGIDTMYKTHIANARKAGLLVGAYAFTYNYISAVDQADAFIKAAGDVDLYFNDVENKDAQTPAQAQNFHDRIRDRWGKDSGLYMSESGYYTATSVDYRWVANWTREPKIRWDFWQKRGSPLDLDEYHGTEAELRKRFGIPPAPPSDVDVSKAGYPAPGVPSVGDVHGGAVLYRKLDDTSGALSDPAGTLTAPRTLPYIGAPFTGVRMFVHNATAFYVKDTDVDHPLREVPPADCTAAVSAEYDRVTSGSKITFPPKGG